MQPGCTPGCRPGLRSWLKGELQGKVVAHAAQARDGACCHIRKIGVVAECLTAVNIGEMHLDKRNLDGNQGITKRNAGVGQSRRIDDDERRSLYFRGMNPLDELTFMIALEAFDRDAENLTSQGQPVIDVLQAFGAINLGFARSQQIQVGSVENKYGWLLFTRFLRMRPGVLRLRHGRKFAANDVKLSNFSGCWAKLPLSKGFEQQFFQFGLRQSSQMRGDDTAIATQDHRVGQATHLVSQLPQQFDDLISGD